MFKLRWTSALAVTLVAATASVAQAQDYPDMTGVWTANADGVVIGNPQHFEPDDAEGSEPRTAEFDITIDITGQDGRYLWGTISGGGATEPWLASLWDDGSGYRGVDSDGYIEGRIISEDQVENCYAHTHETMVVSCSILTRQ